METTADGGAAAPGQHPHDRILMLLVAATVLCYAVGYPLALIGHSNLGWLFVFLGGPLLIAVIMAVIRRVHP